MSIQKQEARCKKNDTRITYKMIASAEMITLASCL